MSFSVRDGKFDVVLVAGPRVALWPTAGVRALSSLCAEMGLTVGLFGGEALLARGVLPLPGTGGLVLVEDSQHRIHRIQARAVVRVTAPSLTPDPFPGWNSPGLVPITTAERLLSEARVSWDPATVVLGTGNRALKFASRLLRSGVSGVLCVEPYAHWGAKRFAGWEVERRHFETLGGKIVEARPVSLSSKGPMLYEFRVEDERGVRVLEAARIVSAGPFRDSPGVREYPPGSFLFELEQTAGASREEDFEGWMLEEERGRILGGKIVKTLVSELGPRREDLEAALRRARGRLKRGARHREEPFLPAYQGKWTAPADARRLRSFSGVPQRLQLERPVASIECVESIACDLCEKACPEGAISFSKTRDQVLNESKCTACGLCLTACPSATTLLIHERESVSTSQVTLSWRGSRPWAVGDFATILNRRGENMGSGRVSAILPSSSEAVQHVQVDVPGHLLWEARALKRGRSQAVSDADRDYAISLARDFREEKIEITVNGERRLVREGVPITVALFETGQNRAEDALYCPDGSCGLCHVVVDGVKKLACQTGIHKGMAIRIGDVVAASPTERDRAVLCPCRGVTRDEILERMKQGKLRSPEAVISVTHVGEGKCHGQLCGDPLRRLLESQGLDCSRWIDWRFPWSSWTLTPASHG